MLNLTLNGQKDANISHSKFLPKVVGWLGTWQKWQMTVSLGPRLHILAVINNDIRPC